MDGIEFRLSELFTLRRNVQLPNDFDMKDPDVLLEDTYVSNSGIIKSLFKLYSEVVHFNCF